MSHIKPALLVMAQPDGGATEAVLQTLFNEARQRPGKHVSVYVNSDLDVNGVMMRFLRNHTEEHIRKVLVNELFVYNGFLAFDASVAEGIQEMHPGKEIWVYLDVPDCMRVKFLPYCGPKVIFVRNQGLGEFCRKPGVVLRTAVAPLCTAVMPLQSDPTDTV